MHILQEFYHLQWLGKHVKHHFTPYGQILGNFMSIHVCMHIILELNDHWS